MIRYKKIIKTYNLNHYSIAIIQIKRLSPERMVLISKAEISKEKEEKEIYLLPPQIRSWVTINTIYIIIYIFLLPMYYMNKQTINIFDDTWKKIWLDLQNWGSSLEELLNNTNKLYSYVLSPDTKLHFTWKILLQTISERYNHYLIFRTRWKFQKFK